MAGRNAVAIALALTVLAAGAGAQGTPPIVAATVLIHETGQPLGYSVVSVPQQDRQQFTNDRGGVTLRDLPTGSVRLRFKHIGYTPMDTVLTLRMNDTLRVFVTLRKAIITLAAMRITGDCEVRNARAGSDSVLGALFDQVRENAERYRLLTETNPFWIVSIRARGAYERNGAFRYGRLDTVRATAANDVPYRPGDMIRPNGANYQLAVPELTDFGDPLFIDNHCFIYSGQGMLDSIPVIFVDYRPIPSIREPDVKGRLTVRASDFQLVRNVMELTGVPDQIRKSIPSFRGMSVDMRFREILPGIAVMDVVQSRITNRSPIQATGEHARSIDIQWVKGPP